MTVSSRSHAAEQKFDNRNRQDDDDDHHHNAARRDQRLGFADGGRRRDWNDIDPARDNGGWLDVQPAIDRWLSLIGPRPRFPLCETTLILTTNTAVRSF